MRLPPIRVDGIDAERCVHCGGTGLMLDAAPPAGKAVPCEACEGVRVYWPAFADCAHCQGYGLEPGVWPRAACRACDAAGLLVDVDPAVRREVRRIKRGLLGLP